MRILAIESSCDETAAAVVDDGTRVLSNVVASQTSVHRAYNGVVPELASRCHIEYALPVVRHALELAGTDESGEGIDAVAVTRGPGLVGSLLVGIETAKTLAWRWRRPLVPVHHTVGHLLSVFCLLSNSADHTLEVLPEGMENPPRFVPREPHVAVDTNPSSEFTFPFLGLAVSGGHSSLVRVDSPRRMRALGGTLDDAPGEAYDKVAKCLGLKYPGGPEVDRLAREGNPEGFRLPRPVLHARGYDFSFSGLKTAVVRVIEDRGGVEVFHASEALLNDMCASFQAAVVDVLITKSQRALRDESLKRLAVVGGVACNSGLRSEVVRRLRGTHLVFPTPALCTDNAAMIGAAAAHLESLDPPEALRLNARAGWTIQEALER